MNRERENRRKSELYDFIAYEKIERIFIIINGEKKGIMRFKTNQTVCHIYIYKCETVQTTKQTNAMGEKSACRFLYSLRIRLLFRVVQQSDYQ